MLCLWTTAGAQQALLVATLTGPDVTAVLSYSVGTQIAMAVWSVVLMTGPPWTGVG